MERSGPLAAVSHEPAATERRANGRRRRSLRREIGSARPVERFGGGSENCGTLGHWKTVLIAMDGVKNTTGCARYSEVLLPSWAAESEQELLRHVAACPDCAALLASRSRVAESLSKLPRRSPENRAGGALDFAAIMAQVDEARFDSKLERDGERAREQLRLLPVLAAPASLTFDRVVPGALPIASVVRLHLRLRRAAAVAAAALVGLSLWPLLQSSPARRGFAAETAALSDRPSLAVRIVRVASAPHGGSDPSLSTPILPGRASIPLRGGP